MKTICYVGAQGNRMQPDDLIDFVRKDTSLKTYEPILPLIPIMVQTSRTENQNSGRKEKLQGLGQQIKLDNILDELCVVGTTKGILELFREADQSPQIFVRNPPGVFIIFHSKSRLLRKRDEVVIKVASGHFGAWAKWADTTTVLKQKKLNSKWQHQKIDIECTQLDGKYSIHPGQLVLPLKNIFDRNKIS